MEDVMRITEVLGGDRILGRNISPLRGARRSGRKGLPLRGNRGDCESDRRESPGVGCASRFLKTHDCQTEGREAAQRGGIGPPGTTGTGLRSREEVFEDKEKARRWIHKPNRVLGGRTPLQALGTDIGTLEVVRILGRIEFGVYS